MISSERRRSLLRATTRASGGRGGGSGQRGDLAGPGKRGRGAVGRAAGGQRAGEGRACCRRAAVAGSAHRNRPVVVVTRKTEHRPGLTAGHGLGQTRAARRASGWRFALPGLPDRAGVKRYREPTRQPADPSRSARAEHQAPAGDRQHGGLWPSTRRPETRDARRGQQGQLRLGLRSLRTYYYGSLSERVHHQTGSAHGAGAARSGRRRERVALSARASSPSVDSLAAANHRAGELANATARGSRRRHTGFQRRSRRRISGSARSRSLDGDSHRLHTLRVRHRTRRSGGEVGMDVEEQARGKTHAA